MEYIAALLWGIVVMLSFFGWGVGFVRVVGDFEEKPSKFLSEYFAYKATLGMAVLVVLGGVLNLLGVISPTLCVAIVVGGAVWAVKEIFCYYMNPPKKTRQPKKEQYQHVKLFVTTALWVLVIFAACLLDLKSGWTIRQYNIHDDWQAYMVFPHKMLQNGSLGVDPFSERRLESSLGGQYFLHTLFLSVLENENFRVLDVGVVLILFAAMVYGVCKRRGIPEIYRMPLVLTVFCFENRAYNLTTGVGSYLIILCIFETFLRSNLSKKNLLGSSVTAAVLLAAACILKSTNIPAVGLFLVSYFTISLLIEKKRRGVISRKAILIGLFMLAFMLPWMISLYLSSGTFLCPFLGLGYSGLKYYDDFHVIGAEQISLDVILTSLWQHLWSLYIPVAIGCFMIIRTQAFKREKIPFLIATIITIVGMNIVFCWMRRYHQGATYAGMIVIVLWGFGAFFQTLKGTSLTTFQKRTCFMLILFLSLTTINNLVILKKKTMLAVSNITEGVLGRRLDTEQVVKNYRNLFNVVPRGQIILTRLDKPYLLDFTKHEVWLNDWPGGASPPPGLPYKQKDGEALSAYLLSKNIRYVVYSYANEANYDSKNKAPLLPSNKYAWGRSVALHIYDFHDTLMNLSRKRQHIYDDSKIFILDLAVVVPEAN